MICTDFTITGEIYYVSSSGLILSPELSALLITPEQTEDTGRLRPRRPGCDHWRMDGVRETVTTSVYWHLWWCNKRVYFEASWGLNKFFQGQGSMRWAKTETETTRRDRRRHDTDYTHVTGTKQWVSLPVIPCNPLTRLGSVSGIMSAEEAVLQVIRGHTWQVSQ